MYIVQKEDHQQGNTYHLGPFPTFDEAAAWADKDAYEYAESPDTMVDGSTGEVWVRDSTDVNEIFWTWTVLSLIPVNRK